MHGNMLEVKKDCEPYHVLKLMEAWNDWGISGEQQVQWLKDLGLWRSMILYHDE